jgi:hypothetical protein
MKKNYLLMFIFAFAVVLSVSLVSAASLTDLALSAINGTWKVIEPVLAGLLGTEEIGQLLGKLLIAVIICSIIYNTITRTALKNVIGDEDSWVPWVVSVGVSILGTRFLSEEFVANIVLSNSALVVSVVALLPFVLFLFITTRWTSGFARKAAWILFAVVFLALWVTWDSSHTSLKLGKADWIYPLTAFLAVLVALFDGTIQRTLRRIQKEKTMTDAQYRVYIKAMKEREELNLLYFDAVKNKEDQAAVSLKKQVDAIDKAIKELQSRIK